MNPGRTEVLGQHVTNPSTPSAGGTSIATGWCGRCKTCYSINDVAKSCGKCNGAVIDKEWPVSVLEDRITAQFEQEVRRRGRLAYQDAMRVDPIEGAEMRSQYMADFRDGKYNWDDQGANIVNHVRSSRAATWGAMYLIYLMLKRCDQSMTEETARDIWLANPDDTMQTYLWAMNVPGNAKAPATRRPTGAQAGGTTSPETTGEPELAPTFG